MSEPIFYIGIILCILWLGVLFFVDGKKKSVLIIIGGVVSMILLVYTHQWELYGIGFFAGLLCGGTGIGYRQDKLKEMQKENGILKTMIIFAIFCALCFMVIAAAFPDLEVCLK